MHHRNIIKYTWSVFSPTVRYFKINRTRKAVRRDKQVLEGKWNELQDTLKYANRPSDRWTQSDQEREKAASGGQLTYRITEHYTRTGVDWGGGVVGWTLVGV